MKGSKIELNNRGKIISVFLSYHYILYSVFKLLNDPICYFLNTKDDCPCICLKIEDLKKILLVFSDFQEEEYSDVICMDYCVDGTIQKSQNIPLSSSIQEGFIVDINNLKNSFLHNGDYFAALKASHSGFLTIWIPIFCILAAGDKLGTVIDNIKELPNTNMEDSEQYKYLLGTLSKTVYLFFRSNKNNDIVKTLSIQDLVSNYLRNIMVSRQREMISNNYSSDYFM